MGKVIRKREGMRVLAAAVKELDGLRGKVGFFESAKYPSGTPVAHVASIQEFGTKDIPARSFMRTTIAERSDEWVKQFGLGAKAVAKGSYTAHQIMDAVGMAAAGDIARKISKVTTPPLKPATVAARRRRYADKKTTGSLTKPLVDTAVMVNAVTHVVEKE